MWLVFAISLQYECDVPVDGHGLHIAYNINTKTFVHDAAGSARLLLSTEVQPLALDYGNGD